MLAKIAAKTIPGVAEHAEHAEHVAHVEAPAAPAVEPKPEPAVELTPQQLLDSVLDALPQAPEPGKRRRAGRRASSAETRHGGSGEAASAARGVDPII